MLRILGSNRRACDALSRRDMIQAGGASLLGLGLADLLHASEGNEPQLTRGFGRAKNVILLFLYGGVSQLDTLDPKPGAPEDIRGPFSSISTSLNGVQISEHLPKLAKMADRVSLVRSMTHPYPIHGVAFATTGVKHTDIPMELNRDDSRHWPYFGSVLDYLHEVDNPNAPQPAVPATMHLPWMQSSRSGPHKRSGLLGGFLGPRYNPVVAEFVGDATNPRTYRPNDPYGGIKQDCRFEIQGTGLPNGLTIDRVSTRSSLLDQFNTSRRDLDKSKIGSSLDRFRQSHHHGCPRRSTSPKNPPHCEIGTATICSVNRHCWPGGWWSQARVWCRCSGTSSQFPAARGTRMRSRLPGCVMNSAPDSTRHSLRCSRIWTTGACWTKRWCSV